MAINLGDINFGLGPDTSRLDQARKAVLDFGQAVNRTARLQSEGSRKVEADLRRQERAILSAMQKTLGLNQAIRATGNSDTLIKSTTSSFNRLVKELANGQVSALQFQRSMEDFQASTGRVTRAIKDQQQALREKIRTEKEAIAATAKAQQVTDANTKAAMDGSKLQLKIDRDAMREKQRIFDSNIKAAQDASRLQLKIDRDTAKEQEKIAITRANAIFGANSRIAAIQARAQSVGAPASIGQNASALLSTFQQSFSSAGGNRLAQIGSIQTFKKGLQELQFELSKYKKAADDAGKTNLETSLRRIADVSVLLSGPMSGIATRLSLISSVADKVSISTAALVTGIAGATYAFYKLGQSSIDTAKQIQRIDQALTSLHGNQAVVNTDMRYLMQTSDRAGTQFISTAQAYARLTAASQGTNLEGERTRTIFENISFAGTKLGLTNDDLAGTLRAVEQIMSKGTVQAEELRGQLGDRLPGAVNIMAEALGVTTAELNKMMKQGQVTSDSLVKFSEVLAKRLGVDTAKTIDTIVAAENRLDNAFLRLNDRLDQAVGFSSAYMNALESLSGTLDWLTANLNEVINTFGALAGAAIASIAAIYAPAVIAGFGTLITTIRTASSAMAAFNAIILANPLGAFASILVRVGVAAAGAVAGYQLMSSAIGETSDAHFGALNGVKAFIKGQEDSKKSVRATTLEYIKQQEVLMAGYKTQITALEGQRTQVDALMQKTASQTMPAFGPEGLLGPVGQSAELEGLQNRFQEITTQIDNLRKASGDATGDLQKLYDILNKPSNNETGKPLNPITAGESKGGTRTELGRKNALDTIRETQQQLEILYMPRTQQAWARIQVDVNKQVENFRDSLTKAKIPAAEVTTLTKQYGESLLKLKQAEYILPNQVTAWDALANAIGNGMDTALDNMIDAIQDGEDAMDALRNAGRALVANLIKDFAQLAVLNPIKNAIFGGNPQTGSPWTTLAGNLFGGIGNLSGATTSGFGVAAGLFGGIYADGGAFGGNGSIINSPTMFNNSNGPALAGEAGPEGILPLRRGPDGRLGVSAYGGGGSGEQIVVIRVVSDDEKFSAYVDERASAVVTSAAPGIVNQSVRQSKNIVMPTYNQYQNETRGADYRL